LRNSIIYVLLLFSLAYSVPDGSGTSTDPYQISDINDFIWITENSDEWGNNYFLQTDDIDALGATIEPIGQGPPVNLWFQNSSYNGAGHTISNVVIDGLNQSGEGMVSRVGLFGQALNSNIENLGLINLTINNGYDYVGGLVGMATSTVVKNCYTSGIINLESGTASGGLIGAILGTAHIQNSYSICIVNGNNGVGGLVGNIISGIVENCYSIGFVSGNDQVGGLIGAFADDAIIYNSFWDVESSGQESSDGGEGKTTDQMKTLETFVSAGWDFEGEEYNGVDNYWDMDRQGNLANGYPLLSWENGSDIAWSNMRIYVSSDGQDDSGDGSLVFPYATIQKAINESFSGDTVLVSPGNYIENIDYNEKKIIVASEYLITGDTSLVSSTLIQGESSGYVATLNGSLIGFTIQGGYSDFQETDGIYVPQQDDGTHILLSNIEVRGCKIYNGSGVAITLETSSVTLENLKLIDNQDQYNSDGVLLIKGQGGSVNIDNCLFENNRAALGSAIKISGEYQVTLDNSIIHNNQTTLDSGGTIWCEGGSELIIKNMLMANNSSGISVLNEQTDQKLAIINSTIDQNNYGLHLEEEYPPTNEKPGLVIVNSIFSGHLVDISGVYTDPEFISQYIDKINIYHSIIDTLENWDIINSGSQNTTTANYYEDSTSYVLSSFSPAIGGGISSITINDVEYMAPDEDLYNQPRPNPSGSNPDMGAIENILGVPEQDITSPEITSVSLVPSSFISTNENSIVELELSEPIESYEVVLSTTTESGADIQHMYYSDPPRLNIILEAPFAFMDTVTIMVSSLTDLFGNQSDEYNYVYYTNLLADYNYDLKIDIMDLGQFIDGWNTNNLAYELAPVSGSIPNFIQNLNNDYDIRDAMTFSRMWYWYNSAAPNMIAMNESFGNGININQIGGQIIFEIPEEVIASEVSIKYFQEDISIDYIESVKEENNIVISRVFEKDMIMSQVNGFIVPSEREIIFNISSLSNIVFPLIINYHLVGTDGSMVSQGFRKMNFTPIPSEVILSQNYPNPFNPTTTLRYDLPQDEFVNITIYDMLGNVISNLVNSNQTSGYKSIPWNATNNKGAPVSAGVYLYKIQAGDFVDTKKMILLK